MEVQLLILLSLLLTTTTALSPSPSPTAPPKTRPSTPTAPPKTSPSTPTAPPKTRPSTPTAPPKTSPSIPTPSSPSTLDPKQLSALRSMNLPTSRNPCTLPPPHNYTTCDSSTPFRHVTALSLSNCSSDLDLSSAALRPLAPSLASLSFLHCPIPAPHLPSPLLSSLKSFSVASSLKSLTGVYLSRLANLTDLTVSDSSINASGPRIILSHMTPLRTLTITRTSLSGELPSKWRPVGLSHLDLSANDLGGPVHASIGQLTKLQFLNLSSNKFSGAIPNTIANMLALKTAVFSGNSLTGPLPDTFTMLPGLEHLDLSSNQLNGSLPKFFTKMKGLKYLNLENNNFHGVFPYTAAFVKSLDVFKVGGNSNLCYNHTVLSSKLKLGIAKCDKYGMPVSPPTERLAPTESEASSADDGASSGKGGHHGPNKMVLVVAIGLSCLVFLIIFLVCLSKMCR